MKRTFILVDFENVQPTSLGVLKPEGWDIKVFAGAHQRKVEFGLVQALQPFGDRAEYIQIVGSGKDALDFHIAFYIGRLSAEHPGAGFIIVSRDTGFDPLIRHLAKLGIACKRMAALTEVVAMKPAPPAAPKPPQPARKAGLKTPAKKSAAPAVIRLPDPSTPARPTAPAKPANTGPDTRRHADEVLRRLAGLKSARPRTMKTLRSSVLAWLKPAATEADVDAVLVALAAQGAITVVGANVAYPPG